VGAGFGPDWAVYLLGRRLDGLALASRIRRLAWGGADVSTDGAAVCASPLGRNGNLAGIGTRRDAAGHVRAVTVSGDNRRPCQRNGIVEVTLPALASGAARQ